MINKNIYSWWLKFVMWSYYIIILLSYHKFIVSKVFEFYVAIYYYKDLFTHKDINYTIHILMVQFKVKIDISNIQFTKTKMSKIMQKRATLIITHYITFCESKNMLLENCCRKCETNLFQLFVRYLFSRNWFTRI